MKKLKKLYKCDFNYQGEQSTIMTQAFNPDGAFNNCMFKLANTYNRSIWTMRQYFDGRSDNFKITESNETRWES